MRVAATKNRHVRLPGSWALLVAAVAALESTASYAVEDPERAAAGFESLRAIEEAAQSFIVSQLPTGPTVASVSAGTLDPRLRLLPCAGPLRAALPAGATLQARTTVGVHCPGPSAWTVYVPVSVQNRISVLVLRRPVTRDARLSAEDVAVESRTVSGQTTAFLTGLDDLRGRAVRRPLAAGTALSVEMFTPDVIVHRGQAVTLIASVGGIEVRASGRALADGGAGARLAVQNASSQKVVEGVVESPDVIRVAQ